QFGDGIAYRPTLGANVADVVVREPDSASGALPARLHLGPSVQDDDQILAKLFHAIVLACLKAISHRHNQNDGSDSPGYAGHRQKAAKLVSQEAANSLADQFTRVGHGARLLQDYLLPGRNTLDDLDLRAVANACRYGQAPPALFRGNVGHFDFGGFVLLID